MPDDSRNDPEEEPERAWPELPKLAELPEAPVLKPNLPPREKRSRKEMEKESDARSMGLAYVLPTALAAPVVLLTLAGWWLDQRYHNKTPYFTLGGALLGMVSGFINMIRIAGKMDR